MANIPEYWGDQLLKPSALHEENLSEMSPERMVELGIHLVMVDENGVCHYSIAPEEME